MIAVGIGLFISTVATTYFLSSSRAFQITNVDARVQENGFFGLDVLTQSVRAAGFAYEVGSQTAMPEYLSNQNSCPDTAGAGNAIACLGDAIDGVSDRVAFEMVTRPASPAQGITTSSGVACDGTALNQLLPERYLNVFWVGGGNLNCQTVNIEAAAPVSVGAVTALVQGVDSLQVQYGLDLDGTGAAETYVPFASFAGIVAANADFSNTADLIKRVRSVRFALLVNSGITALRGGANDTQQDRSYILLDAPAVQFNDSNRREIYSTTVTLPNIRS
jgi:hypothetical protein